MKSTTVKYHVNIFVKESPELYQVCASDEWMWGYV